MDALHEALSLLESMGITLPTPAYLFGVLVFGLIGMLLFWQGRRRRNARVKWIGLALMLYPHLIWGTVPVYMVGMGLCAAGWWYWRR